jgi:hypothetical protein
MYCNAHDTDNNWTAIGNNIRMSNAATAKYDSSVYMLYIHPSLFAGSYFLNILMFDFQNYVIKITL